MPARLERVHASIGRAAEYFSLAELEKMTGQGRDQFAAMALKELVDNATDAAETAGTAPEISIAVTRHPDTATLSVRDSGPGLAPEIVARILDFETRTSDKLVYAAPTRGLQGNALKTILGLPVALGGNAPVIIESRGQRHEISARVDAAGNAIVDHETSDGATTVGTAISLTIPDAGQDLDSRAWARAFALLNPHATIALDRCWFGDDGRESYPALVTFPRPWSKWLPSKPTSPHWYTEKTLARLIAVLVAEAKRRDRPAPLLRDFVRQFSGLTRTATAKTVCDQFPTVKRLTDLHEHGVARLLAAMRAAAKPEPPTALGLVGKEAIRARFDAWYGVRPGRYWYSKVLGLDDAGLPFALEVAVAETEVAAPVTYGLNFSPAFGDPFADHALFDSTTKRNGIGVGGFLEDAHVSDRIWWGWDELVERRASAAVVHLVSPGLRLTDYGKSRIDRHGSATIDAVLAEALSKTSKTLWIEGERRERDTAKQAMRDQRDAAAQERRDRRDQGTATRETRSATRSATRSTRMTQEQAIYAVLPEAYDFVTGGQRLRASTHTCFYAIRPRVIELIGEQITSHYCEMTILPKYRREVDPLPLLYSEPRGTLHEPHDGRSLPLGTIEVEGYTFPSHRFTRILFVEKTGLYPVLQDARLGERFDMAIIASQGFSSVACRELLERACDRDITVFVLHDADRSGYNIARTLAEPTERMPDHTIEVIDLGLKLEDGIVRGLPIEPHSLKTAIPNVLVPTLTERERQAFTGTRKGPKSWLCERIELNAFSSPQLITFIEEGLEQHGATTKLVPSLGTLRSTAWETVQPKLSELVRHEILIRLDVEGIVQRVLDSALLKRVSDAAVAEVTEEAIAALLVENTERPWNAVLNARVLDLIDAEREPIIAAIDAALPRAPESPESSPF